MNEEQISQIHPILHATGVKIIWKGSIEKINKKGDHEPRYLVISTCGIFINVKKTFPSGYKLSKVIPIVSVKAVTLTCEYLSIDTQEFSYVISHSEINSLAALLISLQTSVCGACEFRASTQLKLVVSDIHVESSVEDPIIARFVSECLALNTPIQIDQVNQIVKQLSEEREKIVFTPSLAASSLMPAITAMLKGASDYKTIILKDLSFMTFFKHFSTILKKSTSVESLVFYRTSFHESNLSTPPGFFENEVKAPIHELVFKSCDLTNPRVKEFFYELAKMKTTITTITLDHTDFIQSSAEALFYSIFDMQCFRSLTSFIINKVNLADTFQVFTIQLMNCDWVLKNKTLKKLVLQNTKLHVEFLLNALMMFDCGLEELLLAGSLFTKPLPRNGIQTFQQVLTLDLSSITTTATAMLSLFQAIDTSPPQIKSLNVATLKMSENEVGRFYSSLSTFKLNGVQTLVWDGNHVPDESVHNFVSFLCSQPDLIDLSISDCIMSSKENAAELCNLVRALPLERFVMVATQPFAFDKRINDALQILINKGTLNSIDISGHKISEEGLEIITIFASRGAKGIAFGSTGATDAECLHSCLKAIIESSVEFAVWPLEDVKRTITKVPLGSRDKMLRKFTELKRAFESKYHVEIEAVSVEEDSIRMRRMTSLPLLMRTASEILLTPHMEPLDIDMISTKEENISKLLKECIGPDALLTENDPLVIFFNRVSSETGLDNLFFK